jgi:hypothetical protein
MQIPFRQHKVLGTRTWIQRVTRRGRPDMAQPMISNLLCEKRPSEIDPSAIAAIVTETGLTGSQMRQVAYELYRHALSAFVADDVFTDEEVAYLDDLRKVLTLTNDELRKAEQDVIHPQYERALKDVLVDGAISAEERKRLDQLRLALRIDPFTEERMRGAAGRQLIRNKLEAVLSDRRVSPYEQQQLDEMAENLGGPLSLSESQKKDRDLFALYWQIENGEMPWFDVPIALQKNERCHFAARCSWYELRTKTIRADYSGVSYRIRIAKGLYYRVGSVKVAPVKQEQLTQIDSGKIYFTNKRVIFDGGRANKTIKLSALIGIEPYTDGIGLEKATGKSPVIVLDEHVELATIILSALLAQAV